MAASFLFSVLVVFVATETGTQMLGKVTRQSEGVNRIRSSDSRRLQSLPLCQGAHQKMHGQLKKGAKYYSPIAATPIKLMTRESEMEYIIVRGGFFNSLVSWLLAIAFHL